MKPVHKLIRKWRGWSHGRKFEKKGRDCKFPARFLEVDGHVELGDHCRFRNNVILRTKGDGRIIFGNYSGCSFYCILEATKLIKIGDMTGIAEFTVIRDTNHFVIGTDRHWRITPHIAEPIVIGDCCLIGSRSYINPGVTIGNGAVVAPSSVVTKDIGPFEVWAGNPARKVAHRTERVPESIRRRYEELLATYGLKEEDRYGYEEKEASVREEAASGIDRAAEERERLLKELGDDAAGEETAGEDHPKDLAS